MSQNVTFFKTSNSRLLGFELAMGSSDYQPSLAKIDQALLVWPQIILRSNDIIVRQTATATCLFREIIGFVPNSELKNHELILTDLNQSLALSLEIPAAWHKIPSAVDVSKIIQDIDFPSEYGEMTGWLLRLHHDFDGNDSVQAGWFLEIHFARSSSSIFAF